MFAHLAVGTKVACGDLQCDGELCLLRHLLRQEVCLADESVGLDNLLLQLGQALAEQLLPDNTRTNKPLRQPITAPCTATQLDMAE